MLLPRGSAAAAGAAREAWRDELNVVAVVVAVAVVAAATKTVCLDEAEVAESDGCPDAKATAGDDEIGCRIFKADVEKVR